MWVERETKSKQNVEMTDSKRKELDQVREELHPAISKEVESGFRSFEKVEFQPVRSPGNFEAEFAMRNKDIVFHVWPDKYREHVDQDKTPPRFKKGFDTLLGQAMLTSFADFRTKTSYEEDMGSYTVFAYGYALGLDPRKLAIEALTKLHELMGGKA